MEVHRGVEGHVAVEEGLSQEGDEVAAHGEQDVGEHEGDAGGRAPRQDDAYAGRVGDALVVSRKGVACRGKSTAAPAGFRQTGPSTSGGRAPRAVAYCTPRPGAAVTHRGPTPRAVTYCKPCPRRSRHSR